MSERNFFAELKRRNLYKVPIDVAKVIDLAKLVIPSDLKFEHVLFVTSLVVKESAREGCALPVESHLNG